MAPHRSHRRPNRRSGSTKTMNEFIVDIMELENAAATCDSRSSSAANSRSKSQMPAVSVMGNRNVNALRMLDPTTGNLLPAVPGSISLSRFTHRTSRRSYDNRKKKDDHNVIERKRRNNINNLIKELRSMIPNNGETSKGSTLRATVDYMKELKKDRERLLMLEAAQIKLEQPNYELKTKIEELETFVKLHGLNNDTRSKSELSIDLSRTSNVHETPVALYVNDFVDIQQVEQQFVPQTLSPFDTFVPPFDDVMSDEVIFNEDLLACFFGGSSSLDHTVSALTDPMPVDYYDLSAAETEYLTQLM